MRNSHYEDRALYIPRRARFVDSATIKHGQVVHYDTAYADTDTTTETRLRNESNGRASRVTKCTFANADAPAGIAIIGEGGTKTGPCELDILPIDALQREEVTVYTDESVSAGDLLGSVPGSYTLGKAVFARPYFKVRETRNRSVTNGLVRGRLGNMLWDEDPTRLLRLFDHFRNPNVPGVVAGALASHQFLINGTTVTTEQAAEDTPVGTGIGEWTIRGTTTTIAQAVQPGRQYLLSAGRSLLMRFRFKMDDISDEDWFIGLGVPPTVNAGVLTAVSRIAAAQSTPDDGSNGNTDYLGVWFDATGGNNTKWNINARKAAGTQQYASTGVAPVNDTYNEITILARNRLAGTTAGYKTTYVWVDGVLTNSLETADWAAAFPDTVGMSWGMSGITGGCVGTIDRLEINLHL